MVVVFQAIQKPLLMLDMLIVFVYTAVNDGVSGKQSYIKHKLLLSCCML